ncbi:MAG: transketolase C-terminal domain-containing protein, partial [Polaribacter sp.]
RLSSFFFFYSTFLQRAYDQLIHDVAIQNLPVIFCIDRAGLFGEDGATHHGIFDLAYLNCIPNLIIFAPRNEIELRNILYTAQLGLQNPIAIRYPRGFGNIIGWQKPFEKIEIGKGIQFKKGLKIAILSIGTIAKNVSEALNLSANKEEIAHYDMRFVKPLDEHLLHQIFTNYKTIITIEDGTVKGGFGTAILEFSAQNNYQNKIKIIGIPDVFIEHGNVKKLQHKIGLDANSLANQIEFYTK